MRRRKPIHARAHSLESELLTRTRQQSAVAELGSPALAGLGEDSLFEAAARAVAGTLEVQASGILELLAGGDALLLQPAPDGGRVWSVGPRSDPVWSLTPASPSNETSR
jgi:hypothetical protein